MSSPGLHLQAQVLAPAYAHVNTSHSQHTYKYTCKNQIGESTSRESVTKWKVR